MTTSEGLRAGVSAANIEISNQNIESATKLIESVLNSSPRGPFYNVQIRLLYSNLLEELGRKEEAIKELDMVLVNAMDSLKPKVLFAKGRILFQLGKAKEADTIFDELRKNYANSQEAKKVAALKVVSQ